MDVDTLGMSKDEPILITDSEDGMKKLTRFTRYE